ncbi:MAG: GGDEF domain-containing protein [Proteobacteria bacterium]|uniref:GGDEF domain-containing protein n=1 Tax=Aquabacterium sp. TaxID=1872578 RepID=UPI0035C72198|nr:GGDEF domain-containing protein [Pseudomonadota bacterium]
MRGLTERVFDQLTPAARVQVAIWTSTPFFLVVLVGHGWALADDAMRGALRPGVLLALQALVAVCTLSNLVIGVRLWRRRASPEQVAWPTLLTCLSIGGVYSVIAVLAGTFTAPTSLVLLGVLAIGLLLFPLRPMLIAYGLCTAVLLGHDLGVQVGVWPYAPALTERVFQGHEPVWWFSVWRNFVLAAACPVLLPLIMLLFARLDRMHGRLNQLSRTDGLTGLANRRRFMEVLASELARCRRTGAPLCVALLDIDHFKQVNDRHGHLAGDAVLRDLAAILMASVRAPSDLPARIGGEEFALVLPDIRQDEAMAVCERLRERVASHAFRDDGDGRDGAGPLALSISIGLAEAAEADTDRILVRADQALYRAKDSGRDRVCVAPRAQERP